MESQITYWPNVLMIMSSIILTISIIAINHQNNRLIMRTLGLNVRSNAKKFRKNLLPIVEEHFSALAEKIFQDIVSNYPNLYEFPGTHLYVNPDTFEYVIGKDGFNNRKGFFEFRYAAALEKDHKSLANLIACKYIAKAME